MAKFVNIIAGAGLIVAGGVLAFTPFGAAIAPWLIITGAGQLLGGVGSLLTNRGLQGGYATTVRNPVAPWKVIYGRARTGGTMVYFHSWGDDWKMVDLVIVLAAHPCEAIDAVLFDNQRLQFDTTKKPAGAHASAGTSRTPVQQKISIATLTRKDGVATVQLNTNLNDVLVGDQVRVDGITTDATLNGIVQIAQILAQGPSGIRFTYLSGGADVTVTAQGNVRTLWADFGRKVYFEPLLGTQVLGQTFKGMDGTPYDGDMGNFVNPDDQAGLGGSSDDEPNPWTDHHSLVGHTAVFLRLHYNDKIFAGGLPQISFLVRGKNDIYDPREEAEAYTENAALCIADFLAHPQWGFRAQYGSEIPEAELIAAANICDEQVPQAVSTELDTVTEPAYACNGQFDLNTPRGEILENLLTACGGRLLYLGGQYTIWPAAWYGVSFAVGGTAGPGVVQLPRFEQLAAGPLEWRPAPGVRELFNAAKGTYLSPSNRWQSSDIPPYAQDTRHGYSSPGNPEDDANLAADGGDRRWLDLQLPFTISPSAAQRLLKIALLRSRQLGRGRLTFNMGAYPIAPADVLQVTLGYLNWAAKALEVVASRVRLDAAEGEDAGALVVDQELQETDPAIYAWSTAEELSPQGYRQPAIPGVGALEFFLNATVPGVNVPLPWAPAYTRPLPGDAVWPSPVAGGDSLGRGTFGMRARYGTDLQGNATVNLDVRGTVPPNRLSAIAPPQVSCVAGNAGTLPAGTYVLNAAARDNASPAKWSRVGVPVEVTIPEEDDGAGSIAVTVAWPPDSNGGAVYCAEEDEERGYHRQAALTALDTSYAMTSFDRSAPGAPDALFDHVALAWKKVAHAGDWALQVQAVTATTITLGGAGITADLYAGRVLSLLGKLDSAEELLELNIPIASNTASVDGLWMVTVGPNVAGDTLPDLDDLLVIGDLLVMRLGATFTDTGFECPTIASVFYPDGASGEERGRQVVVLSGRNAGDVQTIAAVSQDGAGKWTVFHLAAPWKITPADGDLITIVEPDWSPEVHGQSFAAAEEVEAQVASPLIANLAGQTWLVLARAQTERKRNGDDRWAVMREIYVFGSQGTRTIRETQTMLPTDSILNLDASAGDVTYTFLPFWQIPNRGFFLQRVDDSATAVTLLCQSGDEFAPGETSIDLPEDGAKAWVKING